MMTEDTYSQKRRKARIELLKDTDFKNWGEEGEPAKDSINE